MPDAEPISPEMEHALISLLNDSEENAVKRLSDLKECDPDKCVAIMTAGVQFLGSKDRDVFIERINQVWHSSNKNTLWDFNHASIIYAIDKLTRDTGRFPGRVTISEKTGLSRNTVNKHLKEYFGSQQHHEKQEEFIVLRESLLAKVYKYAIGGDMKAAKIFIQATGHMNPAQQIKNQQNNFIQINGIVITESDLQKLPADKQMQIQEIITLFNQAPESAL